MSPDPRAAALALLPELTAQPVPARSRGHRVVQATLAALATVVMVATLTTPLALARDSGIADQVHTPVVLLDETDRSAYDSFAADADEGDPAAPVVLSYHDIAPDTGDGRYVVTPEAFESHLQMLDRAGYTSLTLEEFLAYREGRFTPPARSFLLTFDDGTSGLWRYADPVLERYGMTAVSFLITGSVGTHQPYYLTWPEVESMARSGRWEFGSHTDALHYRTTIDADGTLGGALTHREWSAATPEDEGTASITAPESDAAYTQRVAEDLDRSILAMTEHGLPAPSSFAYPFSELNDDVADAGDQAVATSLIAERFAVSFVNAPDPRPASRRDVATHAVERLEVFTGDSDRDVFEGVAAMTSLPVTPLSLTSGDGGAGALRDPAGWSTPSRQDPGLQATTSGIAPRPGSSGFVAAQWAPGRAADWTGYTVTATVSSLEGGRTTGLTVRVGSEQSVRVRVSARQAQVLDHAGQVVSVADLDPAHRHELRMHVTPEATTIEVDGTPTATVPTTTGSVSTGGFALDWAPGPTRDEYPVVTGLDVVPG